MDSTTVTCECGAGVRLPPDESTRALHCPRCKRAIALTSDAGALKSTPVDTTRSVKCPICQSAMRPEEECVTCPDCDQQHHRECWGEVGGCSSYGCAQAPASDKDDASAATPLTAWGDTKKCPACGEEIKAIALRCRYCKTDFDTVDPMSRSDLSLQAADRTKRDGMKQTVVVMFAISLLACLAPLMAIITSAYLIPRRAELAKCGPIYAILGWTAVGLSAFYSLLLLLFFLIESST